MKIALLSFDYPPETGGGDAGAYAFLQAQALARLGHDVTVFAGAIDEGTRVAWDRQVAVHRSRRHGPFQRLGNRLGEVGLRALGSQLSKGADTVAELRRELHRGAFDVIEVAASGGEAPLLSLCRDLPVVVRLQDSVAATAAHHETGTMDRLLLHTAQQIGMHGARAVTASSHWLMDQVRESLRVGSPRAVVPNGIDLALIDSDSGVDVHDDLGVPRDRLVLLCPAQLDDERERDIVRHLVVDVLSNRVDLAIVVTGQPQDDVFGELCGQLPGDGTAGRLLHVANPSPHEQRALAARADIFVYPLTHQSCPYACLEAMAARCAVIASNSGGLAELVRPGVGGLLVPNDDPAAFAAATHTLLRDGKRRRRIGEAARARVEQSFSDQLIATRTVDFYAFALDLATPDSEAPRDATQLLGPDNWSDAWWLRRSPRVPPGLAADGDGKPLLASIDVDALAFAERVMARVWREEQGEWSATERTFIDRLLELLLDCATEGPADGGESTPRQPLKLPGIDHPLFDGARAQCFVDETWRVEAMPEYCDWLVEQTQSDAFVEQALTNVHLRRLAVAAGSLRPSAASYGVLEALYRNKATHDAIVRDDREFFLTGDTGEQFRKAIAEAGLHAPLTRPRARRKKPAKQREAGAPARPEVTVLIPSFKHEKFIGTAIQSALDQTYPAVRVLVVDDHSPDRTVERARKIDDPRLEVRTRDHNIGLGESIHEALATIESPYVALLNSDDVFQAERLERCIGILESDPGAGLVATGLELTDGAGRRLTAENSCIVDVGPQAHGWVRWYDEIVQRLGSNRDWTALAALLRHNHLATSSNMVFRTEWLREHFDDARSLKYCVDWMLFLLAAVEGALRYDPAPLLGYRFHDNNTVWFRSGGRSGYVLEVNRVVARALRRFVEVQSSAHGVEAAREALAALLREHVSRHGETEGMALLYADLTSALPAPTTGDEEPELDRLVEELLSRKTIQQAVEHIQLSPWDLAELGRRSSQLKVRGYVADGYVRRSRTQATELKRLKAQIGDAQQRVAEFQLADQAETKAVSLREEFDRALEELERLRESFDALRRERDRLGDQTAQLEQQLHQARDERDRATATARQAASNYERLEQQLRELQDDHRQLSIEVHRLTTLSEQRTGELHRAEEHLALMRQLSEERREALRDVPQTAEWRLGRALLQRGRLRRPFEALLNLHAGITVRSARARARMHRRWGGAAARAPRVVLACDGPFPSLDSSHLIGEAKGLIAADIDTVILSFGRGPDDLIGVQDRDLVRRHQNVLYQSPRLRRSDREHFEKTASAAIAELARTEDPATFDKILCFARTAEALGAGFAHALGLGEPSAVAHGAATLLNIPFGIAVGGPDLATLEAQSERAERILRNAAVVVADCVTTANALVSIVGEQLSPVHVKPPAVFWPPDAERQSWNGSLHATVAPTANFPELLPVAEAVKLAVEGGADIHVDMIDRPRRDSRQPVELLRHLVHRDGLEERFVFIASAPAAIEESLAKASVLIATSWLEAVHDSTGIPVEAVAAMSAGIPIVAVRGSALEGLVRHGEDGLLVPRNDPDALARALLELTTDPELRRRLGEAARERFDTEYAPAVSSVEWYETVRKLLAD